MAVFQIESGVCTGRGFDPASPTGFLQKFKEWIVKAPASGGPGWYIIDDGSAAATNPYITVSDVAAPMPNDYNTGKTGGPPKVVQLMAESAQAGNVRIRAYIGYNSSTPSYRGFWSTVRINTLDDGEFAYDFRGGDECMIIQTRIGTSWSTFMLDEFIGDNNLVEPASVVGTLQSAVTAGGSAVFQMDTGEAALFTAGNYYYIIDVASDTTWVQYSKCLSVNTVADTITMEHVKYNYAAGAVVGAYPHRWYTASTYGHGGTTPMGLNREQSKIPYCSARLSVHTETNYAFHNQSVTIAGAVRPAVVDRYVDQLAPDDLGRYAVQRPGIAEFYRENGTIISTDMNRGYGITKNMYTTRLVSMARGQDGRIVNGDNWLYFQTEANMWSAGSTSRAILFPDTESAA